MQTIDKEKDPEKRRTHNMRFGATAAVTPRKRQCIDERLSPAWTVVEAAAAPSRQNVVGKPERFEKVVTNESYAQAERVSGEFTEKVVRMEKRYKIEIAEFQRSKKFSIFFAGILQNKQSFYNFAPKSEA